VLASPDEWSSANALGIPKRAGGVPLRAHLSLGLALWLSASVVRFGAAGMLVTRLSGGNKHN